MYKICLYLIYFVSNKYTYIFVCARALCAFFGWGRMDEWSLCFVHETVVEKQLLANIRWKKHAKQWMDSNKIPQCWKHGQLVISRGTVRMTNPKTPWSRLIITRKILPMSQVHHELLPLRIVTEDRPQSLSTILEFYIIIIIHPSSKGHMHTPTHPSGLSETSRKIMMNHSNKARTP